MTAGTATSWPVPRDQWPVRVPGKNVSAADANRSSCARGSGSDFPGIDQESAKGDVLLRRTVAMAGAAATLILILPGSAIAGSASAQQAFDCDASRICLYDLGGTGDRKIINIMWEGGFNRRAVVQPVPRVRRVVPVVALEKVYRVAPATSSVHS